MCGSVTLIDSDVEEINRIFHEDTWFLWKGKRVICGHFCCRCPCVERMRGQRAGGTNSIAVLRLERRQSQGWRRDVPTLTSERWIADGTR